MYLSGVNNGNTRKFVEGHWRRSGIFIAKFEKISLIL